MRLLVADAPLTGRAALDPLDLRSRFAGRHHASDQSFGHDVGNPVYSSEGVNQAVADQTMLETTPPQSGPAHVKNWLECARKGGSPNANMDYGYKQGVAVLMGDASYSLERKVRYDKATRTIKG